MLGEATGGKAPEEINTAQPSALCSQHGWWADMAENPSWNCTCPPFPYAAPPFSGVVLQPSAVWLRFHQRVSQSKGARLCCYLVHLWQRAQKQATVDPHPPKQSRISTTQTNSSIWNTASQPCPQGGPCVWIRLSCVTPFLSHN